MRRIRVEAPIDGHAVSPDSIAAANQYLTMQIQARADVRGLAVDWNSWRTYARRRRNDDLVIVQYAKVLKG